MAMWTPERELLGILMNIVIEHDYGVPEALRMGPECRKKIDKLWAQIDETGKRRDEHAAEMDKKHNERMKMMNDAICPLQKK